MRTVPAVKAALAIIGGFIITFAQNHSALAGLQVLGAYAVGLGIALLLTSVYAKSQFLANLPEALILLVLGVFAHLLMATDQQLLGLKWLVASLGFSMAAVYGYQASSLGFKTKKAADHVITAALNLAIGLLFAAVSLDEVSAVGFFGAYLVIIAVHLGISAASPNANKLAK